MTVAITDLEVVRRTLRDVRTEIARVPQVTRWITHPLHWLRMWVIALRLVSVRRRMENARDKIGKATRSLDGLYSRPPQFDSLLDSFRELRDEVQDSTRIDAIASRAGLFPMQVALMRGAKASILELCDCIIASIPKSDPASNQLSSRELVTFEKLFDDLQGVQR
jgi:hypothetical protein